MKSINIFLIILFVTFFSFTYTVSAFVVGGSGTFSGVPGVPLVIDDLQITGTGTEPIPVKLLVTNGTLEMSVTDGLTFTGDETGGVLYFSGSLADVNAALATLTYIRGGEGTDTLEVSLVEPGEVFFPLTGHLYEYISSTTTWQQARTQAEALERYGASGYLVTIGSAEENEFVADRLENAGWMGASDSVSEGDWKWVTGPLSEQVSFWSGAVGGSAVEGRYENWGTGEPNNSGSNEHCAQFLSGGTGFWNDLPCTGTTLPGYVVEFGAEGDMPEVSALDIDIVIEEIEIESLSPEDDMNNVATSTNLTLVFNTDVEWAFEEDSVRVYRALDDELFFAQSGGGGSGTDSLTLAFPADFEYDTEYYVLIDEGAITDLQGNPFAGITSTLTWSFTTRDEPPVFEDVEIPEDSIYEMLGQYFEGFDDTTWTSVSASSDGSKLVAVGTGFLEEAENQSSFIYVSNNGGVDWEISMSSEDMFLSSVVSSADGNSIMAVGLTDFSDSELFNFSIVSSIDGGETWDTQIIHTVTLEELSEIGDQFFAAMMLYLSRITASSDLSQVYIALYDRVLYSDNGGEDFEYMLPLTLSNESMIFPLSISTSADGSKVMLAMAPIILEGDLDFATVIFSDDYGVNWEPVLSYTDDEVIPFSATVSKDGTRLFVTDGYTRSLHISNDDGETWTTSVAPDENPWLYVAPSASGEGIIATVLDDVSEEYDGDDSLFWHKILIYSSRDNGVSWTLQTESEHISSPDFFTALLGQLTGGISSSYSLSRLGLVVLSELFVITQEEPTLPEVSETRRRSNGSRIGYGCSDEKALNYQKFSRHNPSLCVYAQTTTSQTIPVNGITMPISQTITIRDLEITMTGEDVLLLQKLLNANGYILADVGVGSPGNETNYFGTLTQNALARYQSANGIIPARGYFGPITRAQMKTAGLAGLWW